MTPSQWIFLPGLDGTGILFEEVLKRLPEGVRPIVVSYPNTGKTNAAELVRHVEAALPADGPYVIVAESFSGPLALKVASRHPSGLVALILCSSFGISPVSGAVSWLLSVAVPAAIHRRMPTWLIRRYLVGPAPSKVIQQFRNAIASLSCEALTSRFKVS